MAYRKSRGSMLHWESSTVRELGKQENKVSVQDSKAASKLGAEETKALKWQRK